MVYRSNSSTHLNSSDINNVLPIPTVDHKSPSFTNLSLPPPPQPTDYDPTKQARRSVRRLSIDIERLRLKKDVTTLCTTKRRNSVCRSACDLSKSGLYDDLKSLKTQRNECVQKQKSDKIAVPCTTTTKMSMPQINDRHVDNVGKFSSWLGEGLEPEPEPELEDKKLTSFQISLPLNRLPVKVLDLLLSLKTNHTNDKLKILCLYCDRTFSSQSLYAKHSERVHQAPEGRRLSARKSNSSSLLYPGCSHCHNGKTTSLLTEELPALFHHLIDIHFDKYFACKPCTIRFPTKEALQIHLDQLHKDTTPKISTIASPDKRNKRIERRIPDNVPADLSQPLSIQVDLAESFDDKKDDDKSSSDEPILRSSRRQHANRLELMKTTNPPKARIHRNEETILSRLGITQNRSPRTRRGLKTRAEVARAETPIIRPTRNKNTRSTNNSSGIVVEGIEMATRSSTTGKVESLSSTFDENFYESVSSNVRQNLSCHLDGKIQSGPMSPSPISPVDPVPTVRSTLVKSPLVADSEIHEATAISALTAFPTLLTASQYGAEPMPVGKKKKPITKYSWKWKWDCVKKYKYVNEGGKIVKKLKQPVAGIRDLSKLDMWTQLTMRTKHELVRKQEMEMSGERPCLAVGEAAREDKRQLITQLNKILDTRILPQINLEQNDQRVVKLEVFDPQLDADIQLTETKPVLQQPNDDLLTMLQIAKKPVPVTTEEERVLSGEWARPRCYICYGCGEKFENIRRLEDHKNTVHPHVYSTHYEIVGKELIEGDLFRHFYIPSAALRRHTERMNIDRKNNVEVEDSMDSVTSFSISCSKSDSFDTDSNSRNSKVSAISMSTSGGSVDDSSVNDVSVELKKLCTKCKRSYNTMSELYRHLLDCSGDYDWFLAKKRHNIKYRYFGSRRRKINRTNFGNRRPIRPKKEEGDTPRVRDTQTPKPRPSDAESIQRMLANLPAKRVCRQIFPNLQAKKRVRKFIPVNTLARNRQQIHLKQASTKTNRNFKFVATTQTTVNAIRKNISRRLRFYSTNQNEMVRSTRSARTATKEESNEETPEVTTKSQGVVKAISRRTQRIFPKLANSFRRPLQKRNLRNAANGSTNKDTNSSSILDRMRKSKRVQVTLKKLDENIVDLVKVDDKKIVEEVESTGSVKTKNIPVKKRTIKRLIKGIRGRRAGWKKANVENNVKAPIESPVLELKVDEEEVKHVDVVQEKNHVMPGQIDETSQSSSRSGSSRKSKRSSVKKPKTIEESEVPTKENIVEIKLPIEETSNLLPSNDTDVAINQQDVNATSLVSEEPMDLSQSKAKLSVPVVQEPIKTPPMKRRTRKLNDCIAMLTGKLQEKLGVPFLNTETNILLSSTVPKVTVSPDIGDVPLNQEICTKRDQSRAQTPIKEPTSNHSTPTKRASRKDRLTNIDNNETSKTKVIETDTVVMEPVNECVNNIEPPKVISDGIEDSSPMATSVIEVSPSVVEDSLSVVETTADVPKELTDVETTTSPTLCTDTPPSLEDVQSVKEPVKATPKRGSLKLGNSTPGKIDKTSGAKRPAKGKKNKQTEKLSDENKEADVTTTSDKLGIDTTAAVKSPKRKETKKKKILQEATMTLDITEPMAMETSSVARVPRKRQTKNSSLDLVIADESTLTSSTTDAIDEAKEIPVPVEIPVKVTGKQKVKKVKGLSNQQLTNVVDVSEIDTKANRRNNSKITSSPSAIEELEKCVTPQKSDEKTMENEKDVKKGRKSLKKKPAVTKLSEDTVSKPPTDKPVSQNDDLSDEEMHPWDPEIGFITTNNSKSVSMPVVQLTPIPDPSNTIPNPSSSSNEPVMKQTNPPTTKIIDAKSTTKKKRRKNELAKIIADQLLESFKEVDKSRIEELKLLHDLSIQSNDDLLFTTTMSRTPPPKRRTAANIRSDALVDLDTSFEETNSNEDVEVSGKTTTKRKKTLAVESKKIISNSKVVKRKKMVGQKSNKKESKKKMVDGASSGYLSDTEICQPKKPVILRRRLTICDESPKRMSRNSKETEVPISLFDSIKKHKNANETKPVSSPTKSKAQTKIMKRKNKRNSLQRLSNDQSSDKNPMKNDTTEEKIVDEPSKMPDKLDENAKEKATVNDLVTQIINDFTTSTLNSPTTSPILFGDIPKPTLNNTATKLSTVLSNKKNILNGETLSNGFKSDVSKEITFASLSQPLKDKAIEQIRNTESLEAKQPFRAPFMSPRWEQTDEWNGTSKPPSQIPIKDPALHKLWTLNNKDEQLASEKTLYQSVKEKTKKFLGKISRKKVRKHDGTLNNKKTAATVVGIKRPLLRPSILSVSNATTAKVDTVESENCLKKLESNSLFLGKVCNFENDSISKIFLNEKINPTTTDKHDGTEFPVEKELFGKKTTEFDSTAASNLKSNFDKEDAVKWKTDKTFSNNATKLNATKINNESTVKTINQSRASKRDVKKKQKNIDTSTDKKNVHQTHSSAHVVPNVNEVNVSKEMDDKAAIGSKGKRRKMGSTKRKSNSTTSVKKCSGNVNVSDELNKAFCRQDDSATKSTTTKPIEKLIKTIDPSYESSQDTIISEIVNKIRDSNNDQASESDEDLSLAEIAKNLNNKIDNCDEFSNDGVTVPVELSESFVDKSNFSTLVAVLNEQLDPKVDEELEQTKNCDEKSGYGDAEDSEYMNDRNTELIDMDLEDTASVYTSSMETTVTTSGGSQKRRKRRHGRSILMKPSRKSKRSDGSFVTPGESYFCELCSKTFRTQGGLTTHKTTLSHISKLSEQEFKLKMEPSKDVVVPDAKPEEDVTTKPDITQSPIIESSSQPYVPFTQSPTSTQRHLSITSPARNQSMTYLNNIEPISSPEQHDLNYDRYSSTPRQKNNVSTHESSRLALSQEQRFFYECCSMLKGSDRTNVNPSDSPGKYYTLPQRSEVITKPVTPRSNEQYSYVVPEGSKHSKGIPKIDLNQFSDISSDSNPAYSCPQNPSSSETQNIFPIESKRMTEKDYRSSERNDFDAIKKDDQTFDDRTTVIDREYLDSFSDMGDSFPSSQDVSESEQYTQTILERSSNAIIRGGYQDSSSVTYGKNSEANKKGTNVFTIAMESNEPKGFPTSSPIESPLHSTSSQSSTLSKPRTKAAMKGYDNFKVSIPTTGIDLQQALNRSPNASGCKLAALADIALGNDVPNVVGLIRPPPDVDIEPSHTILKAQSPNEFLSDATPPKQKIIKKTTSNRVNQRKKKIISPKAVKKSNKTTVKSTPKSLPKNQPKDVYDFEDFEDSTDAPILTLSQVRSKPIPPMNPGEEDSETSSYSDRLDFNYESMSESDTSVDNLQKKCLIERIFKSVKKPDVKEKEKVESKKQIPKQELDKLFDGLRQNDKNAKVEEKKITEKGGLSTKKDVDEKFKNDRSKDRQSRKPREIANLEEEWGMSMNEIVELIGVGQRKTQRRCAANKQKTFAENWSSDEYEDFHATKDIFALIHEAEMKAGRARSRTARSNAKRERQQENEKIDKKEEVTNNVKAKLSATIKGDAKDKENKVTTDDQKDVTKEATFGEELNDKKPEQSKRAHSKSTDSKASVKKSAKVKRSRSYIGTESDDSDEEFDVKKVSHSVKAGKIKNRRQTISSRHDLHKSTTKSMTNGARVKQNRSIDSSDLKSDGKTKPKPMARRKRKASEMLYYWSSSSDEEFGRIKPRDDNFDDDNLEQHGWIVGDSHKKLVTLLAHAKGKKIEDCAVKKAIHKKKS